MEKDMRAQNMRVLYTMFIDCAHGILVPNHTIFAFEIFLTPAYPSFWIHLNAFPNEEPNILIFCPQKTTKTRKQFSKQYNKLSASRCQT